MSIEPFINIIPLTNGSKIRKIRRSAVIGVSPPYQSVPRSASFTDNLSWTWCIPVLVDQIGMATIGGLATEITALSFIANQFPQVDVGSLLASDFVSLVGAEQIDRFRSMYSPFKIDGDESDRRWIGFQKAVFSGHPDPEVNGRWWWRTP